MSPHRGLTGFPATGIRAAHPDSTPGERPGYTTWPDAFLTGAYSCRADSTSPAVRQWASSAALQATVPGSNLHARGSLMMLSFTPSFASHAAVAAFATSVTLFGGTMRSGFFNICTCNAVCDTLRWTML